jgi:hypothetical protein
MISEIEPNFVGTHSSAAPGAFRGLRGGWMQAQCLGMMTSSELAFVQSCRMVPFTDQLRLAVGACLAACSCGHPTRHGLKPMSSWQPGGPALTCMRRNFISRAYRLAMS